MTAPLVETIDLSAYEFQIQCEEPGCNESADLMSKGCSDACAHALCHFHMAAVKKRFDMNSGKQCKTCHRPFMHFDTHYHVLGL